MLNQKKKRNMFLSKLNLCGHVMVMLWKEQSSKITSRKIMSTLKTRIENYPGISTRTSLNRSYDFLIRRLVKIKIAKQIRIIWRQSDCKTDGEMLNLKKLFN